VRPATADDEAQLARLAALYERPLPSGPLLLAEVDGELQAALTVSGAQELMDPYLPTAALVELLALRAKHLRDQMRPADLSETVGRGVRGDGARQARNMSPSARPVRRQDDATAEECLTRCV
jgi:hypothetical protein